MNLAPVIRISSGILFILAFIMLFIGSVEYIYASQEKGFLFSGLISLFFAVNFRIISSDSDLSTKQILFTTTLIWILVPIFASLPFFLVEGININFSQALFEAVSGITTTGATIFPEPENLPRSILVWRSFLQWVGGIGIVVIATIILPTLEVGGMQLFRSESADPSGKFLPKFTQMASLIMLVYTFLTILCTLALWVGDMSIFDSVMHAMTTISTGGFSTNSKSIAHFSTPYIDWVIIFFMIVSSLPFALIISVFVKRQFEIFKDSQVKAFLIVLLFVISSCFLYFLYINGDKFSLSESLRISTFNSVSVLTGTGFSTADYSSWGSGFIMIFFVMAFIGGCSGSTSCGAKIFHVQMLFKSIRAYAIKLKNPKRVVVTMYNNQKVTASIQQSVLTLMALSLFTFLLIFIALLFLGLDFKTAISGSVASIANLGPGLGETIGPSGDFSSINDSALIILSLGMILGRLEFLPILIMTSNHFWKK